MDSEKLFKTAHATRGYMLQQLEGLSEEQLLTAPPNAGHNILWNLGHIVDANARLTYGPSGQPLPVPESYADMFKGGTSPADWKETPSASEVMDHLKRQPEVMHADYKAGKFKEYQPLELVKGYTLESIEDALAFNLMHEGVHIGMVMSLRKQIGATRK